MPVPANLLEQLPLLARLPQVTLAHLAHQSGVRQYAKREVVLQKDVAPAGLSFLLEGRLQGVDFTLDGREVGLYFVSPGDYFGDLAVIDNRPQPEIVTALARSSVLSIPRDLVRPILFAHPGVAESLCRTLSLRLRQVTAQRRILGLANPLQRVCAQLQVLMRVTEEGNPRIRRVPTHQELAIMISVSRETVSRVFQLLQGRGIVERDGDDLRIERPELLRELATGGQLTGM